MSQTLPPQPISRHDLIAPHRIVRWAVILVALLALTGAVGWEALRVTAPPSLDVISPADNLLTGSHRITLQGQAAPGAAVTANGSIVPVTRDGKFSENLDLRTGANIITIVASKKFAKPNTIYRRVVVTQ